ncbi:MULTISPECIES: DUF5693 family protein [Paenibacillus]|uniref:Uncharacterized protein n=1 Tax=Paenibacillus campinasensis TaxID=66347 RepID=A0ABW9T6P1_9BACL|nr:MULTISPECIES: DUF5693 family protein [Paenibacillus]MUG68066.1 hypothetical protein [Paenibacillus campinasensis]PAK51953.1 hypothetical protein CHH75_13035 [Paenibacillus sp. 7541]
MVQKWKRWNTAARKWLWILVVLGVAAALPVGYDRLQTETTSKNVELVFNYRDLVDISAYQAHPQDFISEQLDRLQAAGVTSMALFESTLDELVKSRRVVLYDSQQVADLTGNVISPNENFTYVTFTNEDQALRIRPIIEQTFMMLDIPVRSWEYNGSEGLVIETPRANAIIKPLSPDPIAFEMLRDRGFQIVPRLTDSLPYNQEHTENLIAYFAENGVKRILFDGEAVKGFNDEAEQESMTAFAELLNKYDIGLVAIENIRNQQKGFAKLAYLTDYNVTRVYSLSARDANLDVDVISDRFALASKDRNIRMFYLNAEPSRDMTKASITHPLDNLIESLTEPGHAIKKIEDNGFTIGPAEAFKVTDSSLQRYFKMVVVVGAVALIALMISFYIPFLTIAAFLFGMVGSAGLYVLNASLMEQALALFTAISAPTLAVILAIRKVDHSRKQVQNMKTGQRLSNAIVLMLTTTVLTLIAVPLVVALLNNVTYMLVLDQFRGVSLLAAAPIALIALYVVLYRGSSAGSTFAAIRKLLQTPITLVWIIGAGVVGIVGMYYLSRTGNAGTVSSIEMAFRSFLENTFGVRPRNKEFLLAHPLMVLGLFLSFKYRYGVYLLIIGVMGQLSMVGTFTHIHTPLDISAIRVVLGLVLGLLIGLIAVGVWQVAERIWKQWSPQLKR